MSIFDGATQEEGIARVRKRVQNMSESQMLDWLEPALSGMMRHLDEYRRTNDVQHLAEVAMANTTAWVLLDKMLEGKE